MERAELGGQEDLGTPLPGLLGLMAAPRPQPSPPETGYIIIYCARIPWFNKVNLCLHLLHF